MKWKYIVTTLTGLEDVVKKELENMGAQFLEKYRGRILIEGSLDFIARGNYLSRTAHRFYLVIHEGTANDLEDVYNVIFETPIEKVVRLGERIAVRSEKTDGVSMKRPRMNEVGGAAVLKSYTEKTGGYLKVNLSSPDVEIHLYAIKDGRLMVAVNTTGESLHKRRYRRGYHPAPMRSTLAAAMIYISEWDPEKESLRDPMCGGGTIAIEAAMIGKRIPPGYFRFAKKEFPDLKIFPLERWKPIVEEANTRIKWDFQPKIWASDINPKSLKSAKENASAAEVDNSITFELRDARKIHEASAADVIVTNPPFGIRLGRKMEVPHLYADFLRSVAIAKTKRIVFTSPRKIRAIPPVFSLTQRFSFVYGRFVSHIFRLDRKP